MAASLDLDRFIVTDVGSTTTKAILYRREGGWHYDRREAPTTVERPHEDVMIGVGQAFRALEQETGLSLLEQDRPTLPYFSTSSAGGGLAMVVTGLVREVTSRSAERVALGAGAILLDVIAMDDGRAPYERIEALKRLRPDMILLAGGFDGDAISGPVFLAELIRESGSRPKLSPSARLPVVYAGNAHARDFVRDTLGERFLFHPVDNIRPTSERENLEPAREAIHELFMEHVMSQAPGYDDLTRWVSAPVRPTPAAFGQILAVASQEMQARLLAIDIGGATTDVFTAADGKVVRTVSANLGMSYSALNVARQGGIEAVHELIAAEELAGDGAHVRLWDEIGGKYLRPTRLPMNRLQMRVEWALAAVAIREAVRDHLRVLHGIGMSRDAEELKIRRFGPQRKRRVQGAPRLGVSGYDLVIGSGGILSHAPRAAAAMMMIAALRPQEPTELAVDRAFMFPHLGLLTEVDRSLALELFRELGLVRLATYLPAQYAGKDGALKVHFPASPAVHGCVAGDDLEIAAGNVRALAPSQQSGAPVEVRLARSRGQAQTVHAHGGLLGLIADAREPGRPTSLDLLLQEEPEAPGRSEPPRQPAVERGAWRLRRELAVAGDVYVEAGQAVASDTLIARSQRQFLRPFFIEIASRLDLPPGDVEPYLLKGVGDEIEHGELVAQRRVNPLRTKRVRSTVEGRVERQLPNGTLIVRERPERAQPLTPVRAARDLHLRPDEIKPHVRVAEGDRIERGQWLAARWHAGTGWILSTSPVRGRVQSINYDYGVISIEPLLETLDVRAWLPGEVIEVNERGAIVAGEGVRITGAWGNGGETAGTLRHGEPEQGCLLVRPVAARKDLERAAETGVAAVIAGSVHLADVLAVAPGYTLVVTEGFGGAPLAPDVAEVLAAHEGGFALADGRTELRVGVRRPVVMLPRETSGSAPAPAEDRVASP